MKDNKSSKNIEFHPKEEAKTRPPTGSLGNLDEQSTDLGRKSKGKIQPKKQTMELGFR